MTYENGIVTITIEEYEALRRADGVVALAKENELLRQQNGQLRQQVAYLEEQIHLLRHRLFGASSEKRRKTPAESDGVQLSLFNEAEVEADAAASEETEKTDTEATSEDVETETITYERRKPRTSRERDAWLYEGDADEVVEYRLSEDERVCPNRDIGSRGVRNAEKIRRQDAVVSTKQQFTRHGYLLSRQTLAN